MCLKRSLEQLYSSCTCPHSEAWGSLCWFPTPLFIPFYSLSPERCGRINIYSSSPLQGGLLLQHMNVCKYGLCSRISFSLPVLFCFPCFILASIYLFFPKCSYTQWWKMFKRLNQLWSGQVIKMLLGGWLLVWALFLPYSRHRRGNYRHGGRICGIRG